MIREELAFKIKNANLPLLVLHINTTDMDKLKSHLEARLTQIPDFFSGALMAFGLAGIADIDIVPDFADLLSFMQAHGIRIAGVAGGSPSQREAAFQAGLGLFSDIPARQMVAPVFSVELQSAFQSELPGFELSGLELSGLESLEPEKVIDTIDSESESSITLSDDNIHPSQILSPPDSPPVIRPTMVIHKPVRSGQRIYASGANLVVLAIVNAGAEVIADGDIHIYAPLRGRAIAGAYGNKGARVFVQRMEAELISIAGYFRIFEDGVPENVRSKPAQVWLDGTRLIFQSFSG